ncbi:MAG: nucleotide-diphospho-sugar transferase [Candidatus Pedobacter colombiensis]|uniref:Nucleotide-diphospho-sugar transferase n=1 Tax=Candidatus Pedobacter colombiensis TaxID=3121371 RepID=A0AAJ5W8S1_9SPHI|nr:nucleotide-diphospho-sugar transferase [Pedobacter sp.]WEK19180.1 MAG: nucleotide-diphospho-sugar transferase [Pedobacter sp.]
MENYQVKSPVLFLIFNRPDTTERVFEQIRIARPAKLYIAADGPRLGKEGEDKLCRDTLSIVDKVDWDCEVRTRFQKSNLGCKNAISSAIDWFFENEEEGIILEDDCLPANSFFYYCDTLLEKYRLDTRIRHIAGCNLHRTETWGTASTYFANQTHVWGWASWRRVWKDYDKELTAYHEDEIRHQLSNIFNDSFVLDTWVNIFKDVKAGKIDTWDYQLAFINYFNNSLSINPNVNLISNIGFGEAATHTFDPNHTYSNIPLGEISEITFPKYTLPEKAADYAMFVRDFNLKERWRKHNKLKYKIKRWFKKKFSS